MPSRTTLFTQIPWTGGLNDTVDVGFLPPNDLEICDNVVFTTSQTRKKREAFEYFDSDIPAVTHRASSGTTRTLTFASDVFSGTDEILVVGEKINVTGGPASYNGTDLVILSASSNTITYTGTGSVSEGTTATSAISVERSSPYICLRDYWRTDSSYVKVQRFVAVTDQGKLFYYTSSGKRFEIRSRPQTFTVDVKATASITQAHYFDFDSNYASYRVYYDIDNAGTAPAAGGRTLVEVDIVTGGTAASNATLTKTAIDALSNVTATVNTTIVTVALDESGAPTAPSAGNSGFTVTLTQAGTSASQPFTATITKACTEVMNDVLLVAFDGVGNLCVRYRPETSNYYYTIGGTPPDFSVMRVQDQRLWTNDKINIDRLNISSVGDFEEWGGTGTSAALDIYPGDGDGDGLQSIFPPFRGTLFVAKGQRLYRITGNDESDYSPDIITSGLGCLAHKSAVAVDLDDEIFVSSRGVHSLAATNEFGDFDAKFMSSKIQNRFNSLVSARLKFVQDCYIPTMNSVFFAVTEDGSSENSSLLAFNTKSQEWARWPGIDCQSVGARRVGTKDTLMIGTSNSRLVQGSGAAGLDFGTDAVQFRIKTGVIYVQGDPQAISMFKKFSLFYKPKGTFTVTAKIKIDNQPVQSVAFTQSTGGQDLLGTTFVLGSSILGSSNVLQPYTQQIEGIGRGITIELVSSGDDDQLEIYGFAIEYEPADKAQEVIETES